MARCSRKEVNQVECTLSGADPPVRSKGRMWQRSECPTEGEVGSKWTRDWFEDYRWVAFIHTERGESGSPRQREGGMQVTASIMSSQSISQKAREPEWVFRT